MVHKALLKKIALPTAVLSAGFIYSAINSSKAFANTKYGVILNHFNEKSNDPNFIEVWSEIGSKIIDIFQWFGNFHENMAQFSIDLFSQFYYTLTRVVLYTPIYLFNNPYFQDATLTFSGISVFLVSILTMIESIKQMLKKKHTDFKTIMKRYFVAVTASGFAPFIFEKAFILINKITDAVLKIGTAGVQNQNIADYLVMSNFNLFILLVFDLAILAMMIPIFLQNGRRWFDLLSLSVITPLSLTAWIFDHYKHLHSKWWSQVKHLSLVQLIYAIFVVVMTLFIFGTRNITGGDGLLIKLLIIVGGLWRMLNPPRIVKSSTDVGSDVIDTYNDYKGTFKKARNNIAFKMLEKKLPFFKKKIK